MLKKVLLAATAVGLLSACAARWDAEGVAGLPAEGTPFARALHQEYAALAATERSRYDWRDTAYFVSKARAAAAGEDVQPQALDERSLTAADADTLAPLRAALVERLDGTARETNPAAAARAQAGFDCMIEELEEFTKDDELALCRAAFDEGMAALEPAATPAEPPKAAIEPGPFVVFFETASSRIDDAAREVLNAAARAYSDAAPVTVVIAGHTDTVGGVQVNMLLSQRRAEAVADALSMLGVPQRDMALEAYGKEQLRVPTADGVAEPRNRRVEIVFRKPAN